MSEWRSRRGFPKRIPQEPSAFENELYFGIREWLHTRSKDLENKIFIFLEKSFYKSGKHMIMKNHIDPVVLQRHPKTSHDQLTSAAYWGKKHNLPYHKWVYQGMYWKGLFWHYGGHALHPRDVIFYTQLVKPSKIREMALNFFMWFTFKRVYYKHKSGERRVKHSEAYMWGLRVDVLDSPILKRKYKEYCEKHPIFQSVQGVEDYYFYYNMNNPVLRASRKKK